YVLALNDLLHLGKHRRGTDKDTSVTTRFDAGGVGFLFWTRKPSDDNLSLFAEADPEEVRKLLSAPQRGRDTTLDPSQNDFYLLAVSGNGGRLLVRYWFHDKLENVRDNVRGWFEGLRIADVFHQGTPSEAPPLWKLLAALSLRDKPDKVPANRVVQLVRRALHGLPLGRTILAAALNRIRAKKGGERLSPIRVGLVRMCVNDLEQVEKKGAPFMGESLDQSLQHPAYVCGRLLAVYDKLQYAAQGEVNVTVADRYYGMASTRPQAAFPSVERLSRAHLKKLRRDNRGAAVNIEREIGELLSRLDGRFPSYFTLEDQGRFTIGFHHQKADDQKRIAEAKDRKSAATHESEPVE
ncbi:MAG: type I-C CRISPR-associated protein Cas8c/Csd1, partial [Pseudomonadota bacterium]